MDIKATVAALKALLKKALEKFTAVMAHRRLRIRVDHESVRDLDPASHFLFNPKRPAGTDRWPSVLLNIRAGAAAGQAIRNALFNKRKKRKKKQNKQVFF